jgi:23S rRNA (guanosine2251-2'-O)-methyltransferase
MARVAAARYKDAEDLIDELSAKIGTDDPPLALGLDGIEDPRNLGAILRTAECSGVHGVFIPERRSVGLNETVAKAAAGALEYVPVARVTNLVRLIEQLKERNIWVVGASAEGESIYTDWNWTVPTVLFLGSEGAGLHRLVKEKCDALVRIPVHGRLDSLNVSVAAGVLLYEAQRQRMNAKSR